MSLEYYKKQMVDLRARLQKEKDARKTEIIVDSEEELIERLQSMDWNKIKENDQEKVEGSKIDFSI